MVWLVGWLHPSCVRSFVSVPAGLAFSDATNSHSRATVVGADRPTGRPRNQAAGQRHRAAALQFYAVAVAGTQLPDMPDEVPQHVGVVMVIRLPEDSGTGLSEWMGMIEVGWINLITDIPRRLLFYTHYPCRLLKPCYQPVRLDDIGDESVSWWLFIVLPLIAGAAYLLVNFFVLASDISNLQLTTGSPLITAKSKNVENLFEVYTTIRCVCDRRSSFSEKKRKMMIWRMEEATNSPGEESWRPLITLLAQPSPASSALTFQESYWDSYPMTSDGKIIRICIPLIFSTIKCTEAYTVNNPANHGTLITGI